MPTRSPPALTANLIANRPEAEVQERLREAGATVDVLFQSEAAKSVNAPEQVRVSFPLDQPEVVANMSRVMEQVDIVGEARWNREAREQLTARQPEPALEARSRARHYPRVSGIGARFNKAGVPWACHSRRGLPWH